MGPGWALDPVTGALSEVMVGELLEACQGIKSESLPRPSQRSNCTASAPGSVTTAAPVGSLHGARIKCEGVTHMNYVLSPSQSVS